MDIFKTEYDKLDYFIKKVNELYENEYDEYDDENNDLDLKPPTKKARSDKK